MLYARISAAPCGARDHGPALDSITRVYLATLATITAQIHALAQQINEFRTAHPDRDTFASLPESGSVRGAGWLAKIGDARRRFPTPDSLACLSDVAPSTRESRRTRVAAFRWVDKDLRDAVCDFAGDIRHANPSAADP